MASRVATKLEKITNRSTKGSEISFRHWLLLIEVSAFLSVVRLDRDLQHFHPAYLSLFLLLSPSIQMHTPKSLSSLSSLIFLFPERLLLRGTNNQEIYFQYLALLELTILLRYQ